MTSLNDSELRRRARARIAERPLLDESSLSLAAAQRLVYELHTHQVELEIQNEDLVEAHDRLNEALAEANLSRERIKTLHDALIESEQRFRLFMDNSPAIAWIKDETGHYVYVSGTYERRFGMPLSQIQGKTDFEIWPEAIASEFCNNDQEVLNSGQTLGLIEKSIGAEGEICYWYSYRFLMKDHAGRHYVGGIAVDITEQKRAEAALDEASKRVAHDKDILQAVMDGATNSHLVYLDTDFNFVRVNKAFAKSCGFAPDDMIGRNYFDLYPAADCDGVFTRVRDSGEPYEGYDRPFKFPDQPQRGLTYWDWMLTPIRDVSGKVEGLVLSLYETTKHKLAEEKLMLAAKVFDRTGEGIMITDARTRILTVNQAFTNVTGYPKD